MRLSASIPRPAEQVRAALWKRATFFAREIHTRRTGLTISDVFRENETHYALPRRDAVDARTTESSHVNMRITRISPNARDQSAFMVATTPAMDPTPRTIGTR